MGHQNGPLVFELPPAKPLSLPATSPERLRPRADDPASDEVAGSMVFVAITTTPGPARATAPPAAAPACLTSDLGWLLAQANHVLTTETTAALADLGIAPRDVCALNTALGGAFTQIELARAVGVDKTTMVVMLDRLEAAGLAERHASSTDRRARIVTVTPNGKRTLTAAQAVVERVQADVLTTLPATLRAQFLDALGRLVCGRLAVPAECSQPVRRPRSRG